MIKRNLEDGQTHYNQKQILMNLSVLFQTRVWDDFLNYSHRTHSHFVEEKQKKNQHNHDRHVTAAKHD